MTSTWRTVPELLQRCAEHRSGTPLLIDGDRVQTGSGLLKAARLAADRLAVAGVTRHDRVALDVRGACWSDVAVAYCGLSWLGAVAVLVTSGPTAAAAGVHATVTAGGPLDYAALTAPGEPRGGPSPARTDDPLDVVFTSGTTGVPKAVQSWHRTWTAASRPEMLASRGRRAVGHTGVPIGSSGGLHGILLNHLARGVTSVCAAGPAELAAACARYPVRELHLTPYAARLLLRLLDPRPGWAEGVRVVRLVGAPMPDDVRDGLAERLPKARVASIYALTEGGAVSFVNVRAGTRPGIGAPAPGNEVMVVGPDGCPAPDGTPGEIVVRAAAGTPRYLDDAALDAQWFVDGWARTGDVGVRSGDGTIRLVGRAREQIILGSGRLSPETVEAVLRRRLAPDTEVVVAAVSARGRSDAIAAFLAGDPADPAVARARDALLALKGPFRPSHVHCVPVIPRNAMGKPLRRELVRLVWQNQEASN